MINQKMITMDDATTEIRQVLQRFQDGYTLRDIQQLEEFMKLFVPGSDAELIGIGASARNQHEWFQGTERIREIIESDWQYWEMSGQKSRKPKSLSRAKSHGYLPLAPFFKPITSKRMRSPSSL